MAQSTVLENTRVVIEKLRAIGRDQEGYIANSVEATAFEVVATAKALAPKKTGALFRSIGQRDVANQKGFTREIYVGVPYAAYMEFGTGTKVDVPNELTEVAMMFKGAGIREVNIEPRPYLYPALKSGRYALIERLRDALKKYENE